MDALIGTFAKGNIDMYIGLDLGTSGVKALLIDEDQRVVTWAVDPPRIWKAGHEAAIEVTGTNLRKKIRKDEPVERPRTHYSPEARSIIGKVEIAKAGVYAVTMTVSSVNKAILMK